LAGTVAFNFNPTNMLTILKKLFAPRKAKLPPPPRPRPHAREEDIVGRCGYLNRDTLRQLTNDQLIAAQHWHLELAEEYHREAPPNLIEAQRDLARLADAQGRAATAVGYKTSSEANRRTDGYYDVLSDMSTKASLARWYYAMTWGCWYLRKDPQKCDEQPNPGGPPWEDDDFFQVFPPGAW
jgi:hypothetical protein